MPTAFIIDPPLRNSAGHHRALAFGWAAAAHENGYDAVILAHEEWTVGSLDGFPVERVFGGGFYSVAGGRHIPLVTQLSQRQTGFRDSLTKSLRGIRPDDVLVLAFPTTYTMNGLAAWAAGVPEKRRPRLVVWLLNGPSDDEFAVAIGSTDIVVAAYDRLKSLFGERIAFLASTSAIAAECQRMGAGAFPVVPFTVLRAPLRPRTAATVDGAPLLGMLGDIRPVKGSGHMAAVIETVVRQGLAARWLVAGSAEHAPANDCAELQKLARRQDGLLRLDLQTDGLSNYDDVLRSLDLIVLPYSPDHYATHGSGVAEEAGLVGVPIVAPAVIAKGRPGAVTFEEWSTEAISAAVAEALRRLPELSEAARIAAHSLASTLRLERMAVLGRLFPPPDHEPAAAAEPISELPLVDVVVTLHNYRRFIRQCLDSVARQGYPNWRCIVVDDASDDLSFAEGRALVASLGPRFTYERHAQAQGQLRAIATGASLSSGQFVLLLDADDYLDDDAIDHHLAWHLNSVNPVALTSGALAIIDADGRRVASALDNSISKYQEPGRWLAVENAFLRAGAPITPGPARLFDQVETAPGSWFWNPTSTMMLRRAVLELILPENAEIGRYAGDTYLGYISHAVGGSVCFYATVAYYRRHGDNGYSNAPVLGSGTLPIPEVTADWSTISAAFGRHLRANIPLFERNVVREHIDRLLNMSRGTGPIYVLVTGNAAVDEMSYSQLMRYTVRRLWRGATRRVLLRPPRAGDLSADQLEIQDLARYVIRRTRSGLDRRFLRRSTR